MKDNRLTSKEIPHFVALGYLRFEQMVPKDCVRLASRKYTSIKGISPSARPSKRLGPRTWHSAMPSAYRKCKG